MGLFDIDYTETLSIIDGFDLIDYNKEYPSYEVWMSKIFSRERILEEAHVLFDVKYKELCKNIIMQTNKLHIAYIIGIIMSTKGLDCGLIEQTVRKLLTDSYKNNAIIVDIKEANIKEVEYYKVDIKITGEIRSRIQLVLKEK